MKITKILLILSALGMLTACAVKTSPETYSESAAFEVAIHSFRAEGTDVCIVFDRNETLLIDCSQNRDPTLIEAYLAAQQVSHLDYVLCAEPPASGVYPFPSVGTVYAVGAAVGEGSVRPALAGEEFSLGASRIVFAETNNGLAAEISYKSGPIRYPLRVQTEAGAAVEKAIVTIVRPSPDGVYMQSSAQPLREMLT